MKQLSFSQKKLKQPRRGRPRKQRNYSGGSKTWTYKFPRLIVEGKALHLVLKKHPLLPLSFKKGPNEILIKKILKRQAKLHRIHMKSFSINSNHLHLLLLNLDRKSYVKFIRSVTGLMARLLYRQPALHQEVGRIPFWEYRPFTRIVNWGKDLGNMLIYIQQNKLEAIGFVSYFPRYLKYCDLVI